MLLLDSSILWLFLLLIIIFIIMLWGSVMQKSTSRILLAVVAISFIASGFMMCMAGCMLTIYIFLLLLTVIAYIKGSKREKNTAIIAGVILLIFIGISGYGAYRNYKMRKAVEIKTKNHQFDTTDGLDLKL